jgi:glycerate kinase
MLAAVKHLVAAPDKFRGTATACEAAAAIAAAGRRAGWRVTELPLSDGGEGLLDALGGDLQREEVSGPLGEPVAAQWRLLLPPLVAVSTAVIEMAEAAGRALLVAPSGNQPVEATTTGVGQLIAAALAAGVERIIVGCGGSATTDGGWGAVEALGGPERLAGAELVVATDVTTPFRDAARIFGPQKGASPEQVRQLSSRLDALAERYRTQFACDVDALSGAGAAGGLAGGLAAIGGRIVPGFELVAEVVGLSRQLESADVVVTGEGRLDPPSFEGKVVGSVIQAVEGRCPVLCVVGELDRQVGAMVGPGIEVVSLVERFGEERARGETTNLITTVVEDYLRA